MDSSITYQFYLIFKLLFSYITILTVWCWPFMSRPQLCLVTLTGTLIARGTLQISYFVIKYVDVSQEIPTSLRYLMSVLAMPPIL